MKKVYFKKNIVFKSIFTVLVAVTLIFSPLSNLVFADEDNLSIEIVSVQQNGNNITLTSECDECSPAGETQDFEHPLNVRYKFSGLKIGSIYSYNLENGPNLEFTADSTEKIFDKEYALDLYTDVTYFWASVGLKDNYDVSAYISASVKIVDPNFEKLTIDILRVVQHGQEKQKYELDCDGCSNYYGFNVNKYENITIEAKATSAIDDYIYSFSLTSATEPPVSMTGAELKNGFSTIVTPEYIGSDSISFGIWYDTSNSYSILYKGEGQPWYSYNLVLVEDNTVGRFTIDNARLSQSQTSIMPGEGYVTVPASLYDKNSNPIVIKIKGEYYDENQDYAVAVEQIRTEGLNHVVIGADSYTFTGAELNSGKEIALDGLDLKFMDVDEFMFDDNMYEIRVKIGDVKKSCGIEYGYGILKSTILWEDGRQSAPGTMGGGIFQSGISHYGAQSYMTNVNAVQNAYLYYAAEDFDDNVTYDYKVYYGNGIEFSTSLSEIIGNDVLYSGSITGKELNAGKLGFKIKNPNNYSDYVSYVLVLSKDGKIMTAVGDGLRLWSGAGLISQDIATSQNAYLQMSNFWYQVPVGSDVSINFKGTGFNDNKKYTIKVKKVVDNGFSLLSEQQCYGSKINAGDAKITIKYNGKKNEYVSFGVFISDDKGNESDYVGSWLTFKYVDLNNLLNSNSGYRVDNVKNALRDVSKNTSSSAVAAHFAVGNGSARVFDKTGNNAVNGTVGTGMIVRVFDEYNRPVNDIGIAVKGDTSGDGAVNVLDLVKTSRHLAEVEELEGLYSVAGDVTGTGSVGLLDLVKAARDVAEVEEL